MGRRKLHAHRSQQYHNAQKDYLFWPKYSQAEVFLLYSIRQWNNLYWPIDWQLEDNEELYFHLLMVLKLLHHLRPHKRTNYIYSLKDCRFPLVQARQYQASGVYELFPRCAPRGLNLTFLQHWNALQNEPSYHKHQMHPDHLSSNRYVGRRSAVSILLRFFRLLQVPTQLSPGRFLLKR